MTLTVDRKVPVMYLISNRTLDSIEGRRVFQSSKIYLENASKNKNL